MEKNKSNLMTKIALKLERIKELMQEKGFTHFYIPDQFNYDASVDDFFEEEIRDDEKTVFAGYREYDYLAELRYTIDGIYLENGELSFDVDSYAYFFVDEYSEPNNQPERTSVAEVVELAERYDDLDYDLCLVLDHYIELLNRYNQENAYIETTK
jgi:hypothetical protein